MQGAFPGLGVDAGEGGYRMVIPDALRTGHEAHFAAVLDEFMGYVDGGREPARLAPDLVTKYMLLARAAALSHRAT